MLLVGLLPIDHPSPLILKNKVRYIEKLTYHETYHDLHKKKGAFHSWKMLGTGLVIPLGFS
jgi:hypothetical protein